MRSFNKVLIIGNLTKDPVVKDLEGGFKIATFTVATNRNFSTKDGEKVQQTDFHKVVTWRKLAEICANYLKKGSAVMVEGKLTTNKFETKEGKKVQITEIHADEVNFISIKKEHENAEINLEEVPV